MPITLEQEKTQSTVRLEGTVDIGAAAELKQLLTKALKASKETRVELKDATDLDVTAMQLLWAAERAARGAGKKFVLGEAAPESIAAALKDVGWSEFPVSVTSR